MRRLNRPSFDDDKRQDFLAGKFGVGQRQLKHWRVAYAAYRLWNGNPFKVPALKKSKILRQRLYELYDKTRDTPSIKTIRKWKLSTCPMCGSGSVGTVDHFLPRETYAEFSVFTPNLIPTCGICNTKAKKTTVSGNLAVERFLHPYFNKALDRPLWQVAFDLSDSAASFKAVPVPGLSPTLSARVQWHLANVLEEQFEHTISTKWPDHARGLKKELDRRGLTAMNIDFVREESLRLLSYEEPGGKHNSWTSAFHRGILDDPKVLTWLAANALHVI